MSTKFLIQWFQTQIFNIHENIKKCVYCKYVCHWTVLAKAPYIRIEYNGNAEIVSLKDVIHESATFYHGYSRANSKNIFLHHFPQAHSVGLPKQRSNVSFECGNLGFESCHARKIIIFAITIALSKKLFSHYLAQAHLVGLLK